MNPQKHWNAVYTLPRWEKKVSELLTKKQVETYCPLRKEVRHWVDRKKVILEPLFASYVFVHASQKEYPIIKQTNGVLNFLYWLGKPAIIRGHEIENIKIFLSEYENVRLEKITVSVNDKVRITKGPFSMREGSVTEVKNNSVKIFLPAIGFALIAEIKKTNVEPLTLSKNRHN